MARRLVETGRRAPGQRAEAAEARRRHAHRRRGVRAAARSATTSPSSSGSSTSSATTRRRRARRRVPVPGARPSSTRPPSGSRSRSRTGRSSATCGARPASSVRRSSCSCRASTPRRRSSSSGRTSSSTAGWRRSPATGRARARPASRRTSAATTRPAVDAALDALASRDDLDHDRVGAAGVSLGGLLRAARGAFEPRVKAVAGVERALQLRGVLGRASRPDTRDVRAPLGRSEPGGGAREGLRARSRAGDLGGPAALASAITGRLDRIIPWEQTKRIADEAPNTRFVIYDEGNHVCNNIPFKYRPLVADWLKKELADVG